MPVRYDPCVFTASMAPKNNHKVGSKALLQTLQICTLAQIAACDGLLHGPKLQDFKHWELKLPLSFKMFVLDTCSQDSLESITDTAKSIR